MADKQAENAPFNIVIVGQSGRLQYECLLFAASLRHRSPSFSGRLFVAVPEAGPRWESDPAIRKGDVLAALARLNAEILPFESRVFGADYPYGNKIEALLAVPDDAPFVFFDSDTLILDEVTRVPFDFDRPGASLRRTATWPEPTLYGPGYGGIWHSLYARFDVDFEASQDPAYAVDDWRRYLYFNAGFFFHRSARAFGERFLEFASSIRRDPPRELAGQSLDPWLDQVALPLVIQSFGGARDALPDGLIDGEVSCHYRNFPLLYAREGDRVIEALEEVAAPNWLKKVLKSHEPIKRMVYQGRGRKVRALFDRDHLPRREQVIRNRIRANGFWIR